MTYGFCKQCLICGELVELDEFEQAAVSYGKSIEPKICNKCRNAILWARKQSEEKDDSAE